MHPAFSVIFFTVSSGAGFGLFALLILAELFQFGGALNSRTILLPGILAFMLIAFGFLSSVFHLANPKNSWRAVARFRTSWLSREGLFGLLFFPFAFSYLVATWLLPDWVMIRHTLGISALLLAWAALFSTGMIYACLKTIRQWNTPLTPANYMALGHFSGALLLLTLTPPGQQGMLPFLTGALLIVAALTKAIYYFWIYAPHISPTINTATGFNRAKVKILDPGHTHGTFLTQEFGFQVARKYRLILKTFVFIAAFIYPMIVLLNAPSQISLAIAAISALLGMIAERWLFFAEARHVVNLYHGAQRC
ncbi:MAG: DmsC/YnfH family molybdoenzyme membrane anchor subunit [Sulfuricellaceae bacterium]|nr:DmsC/YnfH family molybdoenzyme membrane anchor subunit [Sulfuricellaceae bacterium]